LYRDDIIWRELEILRRFAKAILRKETAFDIVDQQGNVTECGRLYFDLKALVSEDKINEAENLLFEKFEQDPNEDNLEIAAGFYRELHNLSDEALERAGFSREEIAQGIRDIRRIYLEHHPMGWIEYGGE
jgi:hypothetical protein